MDYKTKFTISAKGLLEGEQRFDYEIDKEFFDYFNNPLIRNGRLQAIVLLNRIDHSFTADLAIKGELELECDRCLGLYNYPVDLKHYLIIKGEQEYTEADREDDDIILMKEADLSFNILQHIYDFIVLSVPYRKVHPDDESGNSTCDPAFLNRINEEQHHKQEGTDPRWDILKNIKHN
ncbi:MAG: DUF177 domain-containing protein [Bacteroidia bacterium]|nr:DUF177 domain-containing protein [Bacteroidia bacterium]MCZ2278461.1 DUF177 domain-containing protein [Bacteroidia bacterium]